MQALRSLLFLSPPATRHSQTVSVGTRRLHLPKPICSARLNGQMSRRGSGTVAYNSTPGGGDSGQRCPGQSHVATVTRLHLPSPRRGSSGEPSRLPTAAHGRPAARLRPVLEISGLSGRDVISPADDAMMREAA